MLRDSRMTLGLGLALALPFVLRIPALLRRIQRTSKLPANYERVLILGASSGIGRSIAHLYAARGARVCVVARRPDELAAVVEECKNMSLRAGHGELQAGGRRVVGIVADITSVELVVRLRQELETEWRGLDTLIVCAGVSALQPLMAVAGVQAVGHAFEPSQASFEGVQHATDVATMAISANYLGPLITAVSFIPLLQTTSPSPSVLLLSSLGAVIPPPTRSIYASTKAASLALYSALSIEHPDISFSMVLPSTVEGNFRAGAIDGGMVREADPNIGGLKREVVAKACVRAVDESTRMVFLPGFMRAAHLLYWIWPSFIEWRARVKYNFGVADE